jgi:hypothetical protein
MFCRAQRFALTIALALMPIAGHAQMVLQNTPAPLVTAENTSWFRAAEPIDWNGDLYYPAGAPEFFNRYQMVRSGSYRGIPLYTDVTLAPYSILFVPIAGERMQPYERPRTGELAGTAGSRASNLPSAISTQATFPSDIRQAAMPPTLGDVYLVDSNNSGTIAVARPTDVESNTTVATESASAAPSAIGTSGRAAAVPVGTSGRSAAVARNSRVTSVVPPTGLNGIWISFDGQRWFANGSALDLNTTFREVGSYHGWPVYQRAGDDATIYIPTISGRVTAYARR